MHRLKYGLLLFALYLSLFRALSSRAEEANLESAGIALGGNATSLQLGGSYYHHFNNWLQAGGGLSYQSLKDEDSSASQFRLKLGLQFNMGGEIPNAYFLGLGVAKRRSTGGFIQFGKRIDLGNNLSYRPSVELLAADGTTLMLHVLSISYLF